MLLPQSSVTVSFNVRAVSLDRPLDAIRSKSGIRVTRIGLRPREQGHNALWVMQMMTFFPVTLRGGNGPSALGHARPSTSARLSGVARCAALGYEYRSLSSLLLAPAAVALVRVSPLGAGLEVRVELARGLVQLDPPSMSPMKVLLAVAHAVPRPASRTSHRPRVDLAMVLQM